MKSKEDVNILFKQGDTDDRILKSMAEDIDHKYNSEELSKAMNRAGLVQKEVQVRGKNGQIHTRKQWVKASEDQPAPKQPKAQEDIKETSSKPKQEEKKEHWTKVGTSQEAKSQIAQMLASGKSREDCMSDFKAQGVTWKEHENPAINWMRASMAMNKHLTSGGNNTNKPIKETKSKQTSDKKKFTIKDIENKINSRDDGVAPLRGRDSISTDPMGKWIYSDKNHPEDKPLSITDDEAVRIYSEYRNGGDYKKVVSEIESSKSVIGSDSTKLSTEKKSKDKQSSSSTSSSSQKKFENGYIDKDGDLVADDKSDLEGLVSEITDTDPFDQKDLALEELEKNPEYKGAFIESMGIDKASQNKDGSISVTAYVEGYVEDDRDGSSENFDTYVTFDIPVKSKEVKSVIGSDYTQLTTEKESGTIEGEAHNMMVGWLKSENGDNKKPTESQIKQAANSLKDAAIKRVISSYNQDELVHQLAMAKHFTKLAGGNMDHMTLERTYQDVVSGSSYTQEQKCDALAKLCGKDYDSTGDYVRKYASNSMANASIVPMSKGYFEVTFSYDDGASRKERFDSVKSAKEAADKFIEKEEKYTAEKKSK